MTLKDIYWTAGFLEGEGSFTYHASLTVSAAQVQLWPLNKLQSLCGGNISSNGRVKRIERHLCSVWYLHGFRAAALMMTLYPLMSPRRQEQILKALNKWKTRKIAPAQRITCPKGHPYKYDQKKHRRFCSICANDSNKRSAQKRLRKRKDNPCQLPLSI